MGVVMGGCGYREANPSMLHSRDRVSGCAYVQMLDMLNGCSFYDGCGPACYDVHKYHQNCAVDQYIELFKSERASYGQFDMVTLSL